MKVLQALFFPLEEPGGVSSMVPYIQRQLIEKGWDVELIFLPKRLRGKGMEKVNFETLSHEMFQGESTVDKYMQTLRDYLWWMDMQLSERPELIHAHHPIAAIAMKMRYPETPLILTLHSSFERELILNKKIAENDRTHRFLTSLYRELEVKADQIITVSHSFKNYLAQFMQMPEQIKVIPNGYDEERFRPIPPAKKKENGMVQLITVCRLVPAKGLDILLQSCAQLKKRGHAFILHLIGDGPIRKDLEKLAEQLGIVQEIIFYGYMLHPEQFMPFSDIFVLPSRAESFGSVFAEAALCELALVGSDVGGIKEQIEHEKNGLLAPVEDAAALAEQLERLITDKSYRLALAKAAREKAAKDYSLQRVIRELEQLYRFYGRE